MNSDLKVLNALHYGHIQVASVPSSDPDYLAWVGVYLLAPSDASTHELLERHQLNVNSSEERIYSIRRFEVMRSLVESDTWFGPEDIQRVEQLFAFGDEDLVLKLEHFNVQLESLVPPFRSNYPL